LGVKVLKPCLQSQQVSKTVLLYGADTCTVVIWLGQYKTQVKILLYTFSALGQSSTCIGSLQGFRMKIDLKSIYNRLESIQKNQSTWTHSQLPTLLEIHTTNSVTGYHLQGETEILLGYCSSFNVGAARFLSVFENLLSMHSVTGARGILAFVLGIFSFT
jgi:hypothetical protein